jgi:hypothetical protein
MKKECEKCHKLFRQGKLRRHRLNNQLWCRRCLNKYGENKFYIPKEERNVFKPTLNWEEKQVLFREYISQGLSPEASIHKVRNRCKYLWWFNRRLRFLNNRKEQIDKNRRIEIRQKLLAGLKNG